MEKLLKRINIISTFWFFALYGSFIYTWITFGRFPSYSYPDSKDVVPCYSLVDTVIVLSEFLSVIAFPLNLINIILEIREFGKPKIKTHMIIFAITTAILIYVRARDPFNVVDWFRD
jgi:hypothetical protein